MIRLIDGSPDKVLRIGTTKGTRNRRWDHDVQGSPWARMACVTRGPESQEACNMQIQKPRCIFYARRTGEG